MRTLLLLLLLLSPSPRQGKSLFVVVVDRARPIRCIGSGLAAVCPARFLITPTTVVLRSSRGEEGGGGGDTKPRSGGILNGRQFTHHHVDRLASNKSRTRRLLGFLDRGDTRLYPVSRHGKFIFCPPPPHLPPLFLLFGSSPHSSWRNSFYSWSEVSVQLRPIERLAWERGIDACTCPRDIVYRNVHWFLGITSSMVISLDF